MLIAINYHYIRPRYDAPFPGIHGITPEEFEGQLLLLSRYGRFVGMDEILAALDGRRQLPARAFVVTFDDGLREQYEQAWPRLCRLGIPAIFFANTRPIAEERLLDVHKIQLVRAWNAPGMLLEGMVRRGLLSPARLSSIREVALTHYNYDAPEVACLKYALNFVLTPADRAELIDGCFDERFEGAEGSLSRQLYLGPAELRRLSEAGCLGSHGDDHRPLGLLDPAEARRDLARSLERLTSWTGRRPVALSYPFGSHEACAPHVAVSAAELGIRFGFTVERAGNDNLEQPLHLARFDCNDLPGGKAAGWNGETLFREIPVREWYRVSPPARFMAQVAPGTPSRVAPWVAPQVSPHISTYRARMNRSDA
ncbi:MAG: polysaccharide deacetylase family protein [Acidobacteriota bacterium]